MTVTVEDLTCDSCGAKTLTRIGDSAYGDFTVSCPCGQRISVSQGGATQKLVDLYPATMKAAEHHKFADYTTAHRTLISHIRFLAGFDSEAEHAEYIRAITKAREAYKKDHPLPRGRFARLIERPA